MISIGTSPYVMCPVAIPWSLDQDNSEQSSIRQHTRACYGLAALNEALQGSLQARLLALNEAHPREAAANALILKQIMLAEFKRTSDTVTVAVTLRRTICPLREVKQKHSTFQHGRSCPPAGRK